MIKNIFYGFLVGFSCFFVVSFLIPQWSLKMGEYWKPKFKTMERKAFEQNRSYVEGITMDLGNYYRQYKDAKTEDEKTAIKAVVFNRFANVDETSLNSYDLQNFLKECRGY